MNKSNNNISKSIIKLHEKCVLESTIGTIIGSAVGSLIEWILTS